MDNSRNSSPNIKFSPLPAHGEDILTTIMIYIISFLITSVIMVFLLNLFIKVLGYA